MSESQDTVETGQPAQKVDAPPVIEEKQTATAGVAKIPSTPIQGIGSPGWMGTIVICLFMSIATSAMTLWLYDKKFATKVVAVDLKGYIEQQAIDFASGKITQEQSTKNIIQLGETMKNIPANTVVITSDVAVRNIETIKPQ